MGRFKERNKNKSAIDYQKDLVCIDCTEDFKDVNAKGECNFSKSKAQLSRACIQARGML